MTEIINNKTYNTDRDLPKKYFVDIEKLGEGYVRYTTRCVYYCERRDEYYIYVNSTTTSNRRGEIFDAHSYIIPVEYECAKDFNKETDWLNLVHSGFLGKPPKSVL